MTDARGSMIAELEKILDGLRTATGALRCTVRVDHPTAGFSVNIPCAEVLAPAGRSMMHNGSIDHRRAKSVRWVEKTRQTLVQSDVFADPELAPPAALVEEFGTRSQMVAPLIGRDDYLFGWVSAHFSETKDFTPEEIAVIDSARDAILMVPALPVER